MPPESTPVVSGNATIKPLPLPGVTESPQIVAVCAIVGSILTQLVAFGFISSSIQQVALSVAGIIVPVGVLAYDGLVRHVHARAIFTALPPLARGIAQVAGEIDPADVEKLKTEIKQELAGPVVQQVLSQLASAARTAPAAPAVHQPV